MASNPVGPPGLYFKKRRVGMMQNITYEIDTNDGHEVVDEGTFFTDGVAQAKVSCDLLCPKRGVGVAITDNALRHQDVDLAIGVVDGKIHGLEARCTKISFKGEVANGKFMMSCEFACKTPKLTG